MNMKVSFSTLACPDWTLPQIIAIAVGESYDGIELRFVQGEDSLWKLPVFSGKELASTKRALADHALTISCLDTSCRFDSPHAAERRRWIVEGERMADLAAELGAPGLRVFGDTIRPGADRASTQSWIAESIRGSSGNSCAGGLSKSRRGLGPGEQFRSVSGATRGGRCAVAICHSPRSHEGLAAQPECLEVCPGWRGRFSLARFEKRSGPAPIRTLPFLRVGKEMAPGDRRP